MLDGDHYRGISVKGYPARQHLKQGDAQGINIALLVAVAASGLLRRSIMNGAHDIGGNGVAGGCLGNAKVRYLYLPFLADDDILRLNVSVNDMVAMGCLQSHGYLDGDTHRFLYGKSGLLLYITLESDALHQLHNDIIHALFFADVIDIDDVGMHQSRCRLCLHPEFGNKIGIFRKFLFQHFHCHETIEFVVFCFIYVRHTAGSDLFQDLIAIRYQHSDLNHANLRQKGLSAAR